MKDVILHIGHGKTGTSYLQSILSLNKDSLSKLGIIYPNHDSFHDANLGKINSGNGDLLNDDKLSFSSSESTLISGENLFHNLLDIKNFESKVLNKSGKITVILYTRNVLEMLTSVWGQSVKRHGETRSIDQFYSERVDNHHSKVLQWQNLSKKKKFKLIVRNYSSHKATIIESFIGLLCSLTGKCINDLGVIAYPENKTVNRSMTNLEYSILQLFNDIDPKFSAQLSDDWVNLTPNTVAEIPKMQPDTYKKLHGHYKPIIKRINMNMPEHEKLEFGQRRFFVENSSAKKMISSDQRKIFLDNFDKCFIERKKNFLSLDFDPDTYLLLNQDVKKSGVNPYVHYIRHGIKEGRKIK